MPLRRTHQTLVRYIETLLVLVPLGAVLSAVGGWVLARRALRPVDRMSQSALRISAEDLSRRLEASRGPGRDRSPRRYAQRDARPTGSRVQRDAALHRRRRARAADSAHGAAWRNRDRASRGALARRVSARPRLEHRGGRSSSSVSPRTCLLSRSTAGLNATRQPVDLEPLCLEALELGVRLAKG